jgi:AraC-like DNA-binding protein/mannose-6-phosphate isomerase-like protein (cupin superfamily)
VTRSPGAFAEPDGLSEVLLRLSVNSTVFCFFMSSPWGFKVPARPVPAFHILTSGAAWLEVEGMPQPVRLSAGDLVILPRGQAHVVRNSPRTSSLEWLDRILAGTPPVNWQLSYGGGGERSELLCGGFAIDPVAGRAVLDALPDVVHLKGSEALAPEWLVGLIRMIATEVAKGGPGSEAVVTRLTDALIAQALRHSLADVRPVDYRDPQLAHALRLMRDHPDQDWTVPKLATAVSMSRSAFAERFRAAMGESPIRHLTRYRMARAAEYLRLTDAGIREIARLTGYDSEVSVTKAFRRQFGVAPGAYRKANAQGSPKEEPV